MAAAAAYFTHNTYAQQSIMQTLTRGGSTSSTSNQSAYSTPTTRNHQYFKFSDLLKTIEKQPLSISRLYENTNKIDLNDFGNKIDEREHHYYADIFIAKYNKQTNEPAKLDIGTRITFSVGGLPIQSLTINECTQFEMDQTIKFHLDFPCGKFYILHDPVIIIEGNNQHTESYMITLTGFRMYIHPLTVERNNGVNYIDRKVTNFILDHDAKWLSKQYLHIICNNMVWICLRQQQHECLCKSSCCCQ